MRATVAQARAGAVARNDCGVASHRPLGGRAGRPRRGAPAQTRQRLIAAASVEFNRVAYHATDSNRLARAAGYAPGTFYKHFSDKRAIFLAAYEAWVNAEWRAIERLVKAGAPRDRLATLIVERALEMHRRWRGLRGNLRVLVVEDKVARRFYHGQRLRQIKLIAALRRGGRSLRSAAQDAVALYTMERVCDAVADGELRDLGVAEAPVVALLESAVRTIIG